MLEKPVKYLSGTPPCGSATKFDNSMPEGRREISLESVGAHFGEMPDGTDIGLRDARIAVPGKITFDNSAFRR